MLSPVHFAQTTVTGDASKYLPVFQAFTRSYHPLSRALPPQASLTLYETDPQQERMAIGWLMDYIQHANPQAEDGLTITSTLPREQLDHPVLLAPNLVTIA